MIPEELLDEARAAGRNPDEVLAANPDFDPEKDALLRAIQSAGAEPQEDAQPPPPPEEPVAAAAPESPPPAAPDVAVEPPADMPPEPEAPPAEPWALIKHELRANDTRAPSADPIAEKMKAVGWAPKEKASAVDWEELQSELQAANRGAGTTRAVGAMLHAAAPGFEPPANAGTGDVAAAKAPLDVAETRMAMEAKQRQAEQDLLEQARKAELNDPSSGVSKRKQEAYAKQFGGDPRLMPAGLNQMSANEIDSLTHTALPLTGQANSANIAKSSKEAAAAAAKLKADEKAAEDAKKTEAETTSRNDQVQTILAHPNAAKLGLTAEKLDEMSQKGLDRVFGELGSYKEPKAHGTGAPAAAIHSIDDVKDPGDRAAVLGILSGQDSSDKYGRKDGPRLLKIARQIDPNFDSNRAHTFTDVQKKMAEDPQIRSAITMKGHFQRALDNIPDNFDTQSLNRINNFLINGSGSDKLTKFETEVAIGAGEMAKGIGENAEGGKELVRHLLSENQSKAQIQTRLKELIALQEEALETKRSVYESMAPNGAKLPDFLRRTEAPQASGDNDTVTVRNKKDPSKSKLMSRARAQQVLAAPGGDEYEVR